MGWTSQGDNLYVGSGNAGYTISRRGLMAKVMGSYGTSIVTTGDLSTYETTYVSASPDAPAGRSFPQIQFNARGDLYMVGSDNPARGDVWRSDVGQCCDQWERMGTLPAPRGAGSLLFLGGSATASNNAQDRLVYLGGISSDVSATNDVYLTIDSGATWVTMVQAPWTPRWNHNAELTKDGVIVLAGGISNQVLLGQLKDLNDGQPGQHCTARLTSSPAAQLIAV